VGTRRAGTQTWLDPKNKARGERWRAKKNGARVQNKGKLKGFKLPSGG